MSAAVRLRSASLVVCVVAAAALAWWPSPAATGAAGAFAGADSCRRCHTKEFAAWKTSAHALSVRPTSAESLPPEAVAGGEIAVPPGRTAFVSTKTGFTATAAADDGKTRAFPVDYVVGLRRLKMFVAHVDEGRFQVMPAMREEPGGPWFDYTHLLFGGPGSDARTAPGVKPGEPSFWTGPERSFDARCARCHMSGYEPRPTPAGGRGPRSTWRAPGVDCEACHGPAGSHVVFWTEAHGADAKDPLRASRSTDRNRALAACLACHLEAEPVAAASTTADDVLELVDPTLLDHDVRVGADGRPAELIYEGLSFLSSACASSGRLVCRDCHDAHGEGARSALVVATDDAPLLCVKCHGEIVASPSRHSRHAAADGVACVSCHMPLLTIERGHGAVHDHTIGTPRPDEKAGAESRDACTWCHMAGRGAPPGVTELSPAKIASSFREWWPDAKRRPVWSDTIAAGRARTPGAAKSLDALANDASAPRVVRASAAKLLGRYPEEALRSLPFLASDRDSLVRRAALEGLAGVDGDDADAALRRGLADPSPAVRESAARAAISDFRRVRENPAMLAAVLPVLADAAQAVPEDHLRWFRLGAARQVAGDAPGAIEAYERMLVLDPASKLVRAKVAELRGGGSK